MKKFLIIGSIISFFTLFISQPANALELHLNKVGSPNITCYYSNGTYTSNGTDRCTFNDLNSIGHGVRNIFIYDNGGFPEVAEGDILHILLSMRDNTLYNPTSYRFADLTASGYDLIDIQANQVGGGYREILNYSDVSSIGSINGSNGLSTTILKLSYQCTTTGGCNNEFSISNPQKGTLISFDQTNQPTYGGTIQVVSMQYLSQNATAQEVEQDIYDQQKEDDQAQKEDADQSASTAESDVGGWFSWLTNPIEGFIEPFLPNSTTTCETLPTVSDWLNQPSGTQYCQVFPNKVINVITPFVYLFVGALAIKICLKLIRHLQGGD